MQTTIIKIGYLGSSTESDAHNDRQKILAKLNSDLKLALTCSKSTNEIYINVTDREKIENWLLENNIRFR